MSNSRDAYDSPWKEILDVYLADFFRLFFPRIHGDVDWSRPPVSLEQELRKIVRDAELGTRFADKLFRVWTVRGDPLEVMIHIEIQGNVDPDFAKRIYVYNYRTFDRFDRTVVSVAVLCDETDHFHPTGYNACDLWGCRVGMDFPTVKLRDYNGRWEELEGETNPFAVVAMAHLKTQATRNLPGERFRWKLALVRRLYRQGYAKEDVIRLFGFIDWVMALPVELERKLDHEIEELETEQGMQYVTGIERRARQLGIEEGMQQGIEEGMQQGMQQGIEKGIEQGARQAEITILRDLLSTSFGSEALSQTLERRIEKASSEQLRGWLKRIPKALSLDDVFS